MDFSLNAKPLELYVPLVKSGAAYRIWQVVTSTAFEYFILFLITINTLILMMKWHNQAENIKLILKYLNIVFTSMFTAECILKIIAFGIKVENFCLNYFFFIKILKF